MGNLINSGDHTYPYDAEGRQVTIGSTQVMYDAFVRVWSAHRIESGGTALQRERMGTAPPV
jgi:hypothetical protein